ncbi:MAG: hypothetical protein V4819_08045 [Verrucomicrobiota bacterium]
MKIPLIITLAILAISGAAGWRNQRKLAAANRDYEQVSRQARSAGIPTDGSRPARPQRPQALDFKSLAVGLIGFTKELENQPEPPDTRSSDERELQMLDWQRRLMALDPEMMKALVAEIIAAGDMREETRQELLALVLQTLAESHPQAALEILAESPDLLKNPLSRAYTASIALLHRMETSPADATTWYKAHRDLFPGEAGAEVTGRLLRGTSLIDPKLAFGLIGELEIADVKRGVGTICWPAHTPAQRGATLAAFREYLKTLPDSVDRKAVVFEANSTLIRDSFYDGFENATRWIESAGFSQQELEAFASRVYFIDPDENTGKYLDWLIRTISTETIATQTVPEQFFGWVQADYQAAGKWLSSTADGPAKTAATATYASALASFHPATAAQWALTLPSGEARDRLLPQIYQSWSKTDPPAAAAFADHNGIAK